ncbi:hypothetical protein ES703_108982 [subsurface metagenome]
MLGQPTFPGSLMNRRPHSKLLETNSISTILSIGTKNYIIFYICIDPTLRYVFAYSLFQNTSTVNESKKILRALHSFKLLIPIPIKNTLAMGNVT